ncbi:MAG: YihA family ribosome biogenesis GTP-binding protein [Saprospiraceae bacterium]|nr:YihA family ribosome biogenesis GTP-binding protein [Saprospiraceae bacterium]
MVKDVHFKGSFPSLAKMPVSKLPQFAFMGRSNVGKSSLINMLIDRKNLAQVSKQPGKTQMINLFEVNEAWLLVDLPGYGYAKQSKKKRKSWEIMVNDYLLNAAELKVSFVLIDANIPPQANDVGFINGLGSKGLPFSLVFTKTDRQSPRKINRSIDLFCQHLLEFWEELPPHFLASAVTRKGQKEILDYIEQIAAQAIQK